jgi:hypothetical protein
MHCVTVLIQCPSVAVPLRHLLFDRYASSCTFDACSRDMSRGFVFAHRYAQLASDAVTVNAYRRIIEDLGRYRKRYHGFWAQVGVKQRHVLRSADVKQ